MLDALSRRALVGVAALILVAGCSNNANSITPGSPSALTSQSGHVPAGMRVLPGPVVVGPVIVPLHPHPLNLPHVWPDKKHHHRKQILFSSDAADNQVLMYNPKTVDGSPTGSITTGLNVPFGLAVDKHSTLYVANLGNTITVYPKGHTSPTLTIPDDEGPYGVAVDSQGNVFASNLDNNTITAYKAGQTSPYETIAFNAEGQAVGIAIDANDNLWIACDSSNAVYEILKGSTSPQNADLSGLNGPIGVSFGKNDQLFVSNFSGSDVQVYTYDTKTPAETITAGIETSGPVLNGITHSDYFFQSNQDDNVVGYKPGQTSPFTTLTGGNSDPTGIAATPEVSK